MKDYTSKMAPNFPVYDLNFNWKEFSKGPLPIIFDTFIYKNMSNREFARNFLNHKVIDRYGKVYIITGRNILSWWRKFIPCIKKAVFEFKESKTNHSLLEAKNIIILQIAKNIDSVEIQEAWISEIKKAESFDALFS